MLAGLVKSPSRLAPTRNFDGAEQRAHVVLAAMADLHFITPGSEKAALAHPPRVAAQAGTGSVNYVADWVMDAINDVLGHVDEDIVVRTTIDTGLQAGAEKALTEELAAKGDKAGVSQGALVAMTPDGAVRAMVGGRDYAASQFNRAVAARRQPGSAFKPFVYLTALEHGLDARQRAPGRADQDQELAAGKLRPRILRTGHARQSPGAVAQHGVGAPDLGILAGGGGAHRLPPRHRLQARAQCLDRARHLGGFPARIGQRLCAVRQWRARRRAACDRAHHGGQRQSALRAQRPSARPHHRRRAMWR